MANGTVKIVRQYQTSELGPANKLQQVVVVDFTVGEDGPFSVRIPLDLYTADVARAAVNQIALEVQSVQNF